MDIDRFKKLPLMGILRGVKPDSMVALVESIVLSGMQTIEITMNTPDAAKCIEQTVKASKGRLMVGAGTVLDMQSMHAALDAGASFIVMPTLVDNVAEYCLKNNIAFFPGALSPQEVYKAHCSGATMVKVFPAGFFGPKYLKELKGPFDQISLMAVGGVRLDNIKEYFACKADAVAVGGSIFNLDQIHSGDLKPIQRGLSELVAKVKSITA